MLFSRAVVFFFYSAEMKKFVPDVVMAADYQSAPATVQCVVHGEGDSAAIALCEKVGWGISVWEKNPIAKLICGQLDPIPGAGMGGEPCTSELSSFCLLYTSPSPRD